MPEITLLESIKSLEGKYKFSDYQIKKCNEYFSMINVGDYIYPGSLKSKLALNLKNMYLFMEELKKAGFVKNLYEVYCCQCDQSKKIFLETLADFDENYACDHCNKNLSVLQDVIVLYKVVSL